MLSKLIRGLVSSAVVSLTVSAMALPPVPVSPPPVDTRPTATFTFADATQAISRNTSGRFRLVGLRPSETVNIAVYLPNITWLSSPPPLALDGGSIMSVSTSSVVGGGLAVIRFQAGSKPGLYRILLPSINPTARLQFWIQDSLHPNPAMSSMVLNPQHLNNQ